MPRWRRTSPAWSTTTVLVALAVLMVFSSGCGSDTATSVEHRNRVSPPHEYTYCHNGGIPETLDVFQPSAAVRSAPVLVDIHGGGWVTGNAMLQPGTIEWDLKPALLDKGWVFVSINYRLGPEYPWPAQLQDAKCAIRYLRQNARPLHIDPTRIGVIGASAGGHLASMVGLTGPTADFDAGQALNQASTVDAVVDEFGPSDLTSPDWRHSKVLPVLAEKTFGVALGQKSPILAAASPVTYIHPGAPPFLVIQGADDAIVPPGQSRELVGRLQRAGDSATLVMVQHARHGLLKSGTQPIAPDLATLTADVLKFLVQQVSTGQ